MIYNIGLCCVFFFKQKTAYELRISNWSSDVCSSDLAKGRLRGALARAFKSGDLTISDDLPTLIATALRKATLDRLGLEARAGHVVIGSERIEAAARSGKLQDRKSTRLNSSP